MTSKAEAILAMLDNDAQPSRGYMKYDSTYNVFRLRKTNTPGKGLLVTVEDMVEMLNVILARRSTTDAHRPQRWPLVSCEVDGTIWYRWNPHNWPIGPEENYLDILQGFHGDVTSQTPIRAIFRGEIPAFSENDQDEIRRALVDINPDMLQDPEHTTDPDNWMNGNYIVWYSFPAATGDNYGMATD